MKISEASDLLALRARLRELRKLQDKVSGYPPFDGYLVIDGEDLLMTRQEVDGVLARAELELEGTIKTLGVEVDE